MPGNYSTSSLPIKPLSGLKTNMCPIEILNQDCLRLLQYYLLDFLLSPTRSLLIVDLQKEYKSINQERTMKLRERNTMKNIISVAVLTLAFAACCVTVARADQVPETAYRC